MQEPWILFRFDMSKPEKYYNEKPMARTLDEIRKCVLDQKMSCVHQPLINIQLENIIIDELHLMLRVTGQSIAIVYVKKRCLIMLKVYTKLIEYAHFYTQMY